MMLCTESDPRNTWMYLSQHHDKAICDILTDEKEDACVLGHK